MTDSDNLSGQSETVRETMHAEYAKKYSAPWIVSVL